MSMGSFAALSVALLVGLLPPYWKIADWSKHSMIGLLAAIPAILAGAYLADVKLGVTSSAGCVSCGSSKGGCACSSNAGCGSSGCGSSSRRSTPVKATQPGGTRRSPAVMQPPLQTPGYAPGGAASSSSLPNLRVIPLPRTIQNGPVGVGPAAAPVVQPSPLSQPQSTGVRPVPPPATSAVLPPTPQASAPFGAAGTPVKP